jgi:PAS domain S-box-containing protein
MPRKAHLALLALISGLTIGIFIIDLWLPRGTSEWALYLVPLLLTMWLPYRWLPLSLTGVVTVLAVIGFVWSPEGVAMWISVTNRTFGILVLWITAGLLIRRKHAEEALTRSEQQLRELAENIQEVFWLADPDMRQIHYVSPAYEAIWGRSSASLYDVPQSWLDAVHPQDRVRVAKTVQVPPDRGGYSETFRIARPDGTVRWILHRAFPVHDPSGAFVRVAGLAKDITDRHTAERRRVTQYAVTRILAESDTRAEMTAKVLQVLCENLEWEMGVYWTVDHMDNLLRFDTHWCMAEAQSRGVGLPGRVWASGEAVWVPDLLVDAHFVRSLAARDERLQSLGVLEFYSRKPWTPDDDLLHLLGAVCTQIGQFTVRKRAEGERERLVLQLQDALRNVKTLRGSLPICSSCQKVRDDRVGWQDLPAYVRGHSEADFKPDLCPDCGFGMFPDFYRGLTQGLH